MRLILEDPKDQRLAAQRWRLVLNYLENTLNAYDDSQVPWDEAPEWQKASAMRGVMMKLENPDMTPAEQHAGWMQLKIADGWAYGAAKDPEAKTHPCIMPYEDLPEEQKRKDVLFGGIVSALACNHF